ncbi:hypothetical protein E2C01_048177 [Portunus trituberculatus]|uniref:Uncharacterized protein n=1 Tax=Portunus trituberculatus TaxID=210409 RepID=A0A5B7G9X0_PORTR|nr:hypothetical protein [Portunus trituberculatus]
MKLIDPGSSILVGAAIRCHRLRVALVLWVVFTNKVVVLRDILFGLFRC